MGNVRFVRPRRLVLVLAALSFAAGCVSSGDPVPVGSWLHHGPRTVRGRGSNELLEITVGDAGPQVRRTVTIFPDRGLGEVRQHRGALEPLQVDGHWLRCGEALPKTFRIEGDRLVCPALVEESPGTWVFGTEGPSGKVERWSCATDPRLVPTGAARFPSVEHPGGQPQRYVATFDPVTSELVRLDFFDADNPEPGTTFLFEDPWGVGVLKTWASDVRQRYYEAQQPR